MPWFDDNRPTDDRVYAGGSPRFDESGRTVYDPATGQMVPRQGPFPTRIGMPSGSTPIPGGGWLPPAAILPRPIMERDKYGNPIGTPDDQPMIHRGQPSQIQTESREIPGGGMTSAAWMVDKHGNRLGTEKPAGQPAAPALERFTRPPGSRRNIGGAVRGALRGMGGTATSLRPTPAAVGGAMNSAMAGVRPPVAAMAGALPRGGTYPQELGGTLGEILARKQQGY